MSFAERPPSTNWEPLALPEAPSAALWAWFKPNHAPTDVVFQIPPETHQSCGSTLSVRRLLTAAGLDPAQAQGWVVQGSTYDAQQGMNPLLDHPLPPPVPGDPGLAVRMNAAMAATAPTPAMPVVTSDGPPDERSTALLAAIDTDWQALLGLERQLNSARKQLGAIQGQVQSLNRDLNPDEHLAADNADRKDWQDTRRWLRDCAASVSRQIRDHDMGAVSAAGSRNRFEQIYNEFVSSGRSFAGIEQVQNEFEQHRRTAQTLLVQMQAAHSNASRDGVQRAQRLLARIAAKRRAAKTKRG